MTQELRFPIQGFAKYNMTRTGEVRYIYNDRVINPETTIDGPKYSLWSDIVKGYVFIGARKLEALVEREQHLNGNEDFRFPPPPKVQAKHIPTNLVKLLVLQLTNKPVVSVVDGRVRAGMENYTNLHEIAEAWPTVPFKVLQAKIKKMIDRKILEGCACGCSTAITLVV